MKWDTAVAVSIIVTIAGLVWNAARSFERLERVREDLKALDKSMQEIRALLYTTIGGRRAVRPIEVADDNGRDQQ